MENLKIYSVNIKGLGNLIKRKQVKSLHASIVFFQEMHARSNTIPLLKSPVFPIQLQAHGMMILFSKNLNFIRKDTKVDPSGRFLFAKRTTNGQMITLAMIYAPNQNHFLQDTLTLLNPFKEGDQ
ncbi:UNVERIFIED_CONTAM: hypothetical protein K2H54_001072 [Gekko kuhli]